MGRRRNQSPYPVTHIIPAGGSPRAHAALGGPIASAMSPANPGKRPDRQTIRDFRNRLSGSVEHRAGRIADSLSDQLSAEVSLDASRVFGVDITMSARSCKSLVGAGMDATTAARLTGLESDGCIRDRDRHSGTRQDPDRDPG